MRFMGIILMGRKLNTDGELCVAVNNDDSPFACQVRASVEEVFRSSAHIHDRGEFRFDHIMAAVETVIMR